MFKRFFEKMAGKASITNIKYRMGLGGAHEE